MLNSSGEDQLVYFYNEDTREIKALSNESTYVNVTNTSDIGIFSLLDTSDTIAVSIYYRLYVVDLNPESAIDEIVPEPIKPIIIFAIVIGSIFGCLVFSLATIFFYKCHKNRKHTFEAMHNDLRNTTILQSAPSGRVKIAETTKSSERFTKGGGADSNSGQPRIIASSQGKRDGGLITVEDLRRKSQNTDNV
jgi:hypothetical protein